MRPDKKNMIVSLQKVENVVNPPKNPVVMPTRISGFIVSIFANANIKKLSIKLPITFITNVKMALEIPIIYKCCK